LLPSKPSSGNFFGAISKAFELLRVDRKAPKILGLLCDPTHKFDFYWLPGAPIRTWLNLADPHL